MQRALRMLLQWVVFQMVAGARLLLGYLIIGQLHPADLHLDLVKQHHPAQDAAELAGKDMKDLVATPMTTTMMPISTLRSHRGFFRWKTISGRMLKNWLA